MQINPYLMFGGQCEEAFKFYEQCLGGKIVAMFSHKGTPMEEHVVAEWRDKIMHARMMVGEAVLMGSDSPPEYPMKDSNRMSVSLMIEEPAEAERLFKALAEGGAITMEIQKTFWAERFGMLVDKYGIPWMINCEGDTHYSG